MNAKRMRIRAIATMLVAALLFLLVPQPASAIPAVEPRSDAWTYEKAINRVEPFVAVDDDGFVVLDPPRGIVQSLDPAIYQTVLASIEMINSMIAEGYLVCNDDLAITIAEKYVQTVTAQYEQLYDELDGSIAVQGNLEVEGNAILYQPLFDDLPVLNGGGGGGSSTYGVNKVEWFWWGFELYLDYFNSWKVAAGLGVCVVLAQLLPPPFNVVVGATLAAVAGVIGVYNAYGRGVVITFIVVPIVIAPFVQVVPVWVRSQ